MYTCLPVSKRAGWGTNVSSLPHPLEKGETQSLASPFSNSEHLIILKAIWPGGMWWLSCLGAGQEEVGRWWGERQDTRSGHLPRGMPSSPLPSWGCSNTSLNKSNTPPKSSGDYKWQQVEADGRESKWKEWLTSKGLSFCQNALNCYLEILVLSTSIINR